MDLLELFDDVLTETRGSSAICFEPLFPPIGISSASDCFSSASTASPSAPSRAQSPSPWPSSSSPAPARPRPRFAPVPPASALTYGSSAHSLLSARVRAAFTFGSTGRSGSSGSLCPLRQPVNSRILSRSYGVNANKYFAELLMREEIMHINYRKNQQSHTGFPRS